MLLDFLDSVSCELKRNSESGYRVTCQVNISYFITKLNVYRGKWYWCLFVSSSIFFLSKKMEIYFLLIIIVEDCVVWKIFTFLSIYIWLFLFLFELSTFSYPGWSDLVYSISWILTGWSVVCFSFEFCDCRFDSGIEDDGERLTNSRRASNLS